METELETADDFIFASKEKIEMIQDHIDIYNELYIDRIAKLNKEIKNLELEDNEIKRHSLKKKVNDYQGYINSVSKSYEYDLENLSSQKFEKNIFLLNQKLGTCMGDDEKSKILEERKVELYSLKEKASQLFRKVKHYNL